MSGEQGGRGVRGAPAGQAPGWPGGPARWTSSAKSGVGTALGASGRVWFTLSHGILNEVYYPRVDQACTRDLGFVVTADGGFFSEEKRHAVSAIVALEAGVPAFRLTNTCNEGRYRIEKEVLADPRREVVLRRRRSPHPRHRRRDRRAAQGGHAERPRLATLQRRRLWRTRGRHTLRRHGHGSAVATAYRRASPLRDRRRPPRGGGGAPGCNIGIRNSTASSNSSTARTRQLYSEG